MWERAPSTRSERGRSVRLTTRVVLVLRLRMSGAIPLLLLCVLIRCTGRTLLLGAKWEWGEYYYVVTNKNIVVTGGTQTPVFQPVVSVWVLVNKVVRV